MTGRRRTQTVPQRFVDSADEVVIVDALPAARVGGPSAEPAAAQAIRTQELSQLRERALLLTADVVDRQLEAYLELHGIRSTWGTQERILVCMTPRANAAAMLASGRRNADRFHGELFAVYVNQPNLTPEDRSALARNVLLARAQEAHVETLEGKDPIKAILDYAGAQGITQLFVGHNLRRSWRTRFTGSAARSPDRPGRGHRRPRLPALTPVSDLAAARRGRLKVFLGYAAGVGKTYQMLAEAQALRRQGIDVVIGYFEPHGRRDTIALTEGLETVPTQAARVPRTRPSRRWTPRPSWRVVPASSVVDEFPHTNVPGSPRVKRWEDVHVLLDAGIDVLTTMNVQHLESLNDQIWQSTGVRVRETIPDWVLQQADDVVMVDLTPRALLNRLERGVVYPPERARAALKNFFSEPTLVALRELAMRQTAHAVERHHLDGEPADGTGESVPPERRERLALLIEPHPASAALIRRGRRVADYLQADCFAVYVSRTRTLDDMSTDERQALEPQLNFARGLQIEARILEGDDVAQALVHFAKMNGVTQIFVLRRRSGKLSALWRRGLVQRIVGLAVDMQVTIVADRSTRTAGPSR